MEFKRKDSNMALHIIHTADWHLGQSFFGYDREEEHDAFLAWLVGLLAEREVDVLLISGDVFDVANPSAASQRRFFRFLREANRHNPALQVVIIAGNHDSAARLEAPAPLLEEWNTSIVGLLPRTEAGEIDYHSLLIPLFNKERKREALCLAVPYLRQGDYPSPEEEPNTYVAGVGRLYRELYQYANTRRKKGEALVAMGHLHATGAELSDDDRSERVIMGGLESVGVEAFDEELSYVALGHIHRAQAVGEREAVRYAGSPLPMSFSEQHYRHQVVALTIEQGQLIDWEAIPIPLHAPLQRIPAEPAPPADVLLELQMLPFADKEADRSRWPYVEVQVLLTEPDPGFRHRVEETLADKAVRLTSIVPFYPKKSGQEGLTIQAYSDLRKIEPLKMLQYVFAERYGGELPEELETMFNDVMREVAL